MDILNDRFEIEKTLGKKAGRQTLLAKDLQTQERVVIKLLTFGPDFEWDDFKLFEREAETLKSLDHPCIPKYLGSFELELAHGKGFALVQSYIEALSLEQHLKAGRSFTETELKQLAQALLDILNDLHSRQPAVIHRDIKPSNILLSDRSGNHVGQVYLVDFGSVQTLIAQEGGTITVVGTYGYMPPEQYGGRATPASDLYSLGATLIYIATGKHPADLSQRDLHLQFRDDATLPEPLLDWLEWLTEPSLENRLATAEQAIAALNSEQPRAIVPVEKTAIVPLTTERIIWNAIWRNCAIVTPIGSAFFTYSVWRSIKIANLEWQPLFLNSILWGGAGGAYFLGLGFISGLITSLISARLFPSGKRPWFYRSLLLGLTSAITTGLILGISVLMSTQWMELYWLVMVANSSIAIANQLFATWYLRETRKTKLRKLRKK